jgi:CHAT domain-containing protein/tetratricopeptide (TPR) repeat protein
MSGRYVEARDHQRTCLAILEARDSRFILNWVLLGLANINRILGEPDTAIALYRRAADLYEETGDAERVALCVNEMGMCHALQGEYRQALGRYEEAAALHESAVAGGGSPYILSNTADAYFLLGDFDEALDHYRRAVAQAEQQGTAAQSYNAINGIAAVYAAVGRPDLAADSYRHALELARAWHEREAEIRSLLGLAAQEIELDRRGAARRTLAEAERLLTGEGQFAFVARVRLLRARCSDEPPTALELARQGLAAAIAGGLPEEEWNGLTEIGELQLVLGDTAQAVADQMRAIDIIESLRRRVGLDELQLHMLRPAIAPYERLVDILVHQGRAAQALMVVERSRARILAERLERTLVRASDPAAPRMPLAERELRAVLSHHLERLQAADLDPGARDSLRREIDDLEARFVLMRTGSDTGTAGPDLPDPLRTDDPRALLTTLRPGERMLTYFLGSRRSFLFSVTREGVTAHLLPYGEAIEQKVRHFLALWRQYAASADSAGVPVAAVAAARRGLHKLLLGPVAADAARPEVLFIVPDGILHRLPFLALDDGAGGLLARQNVIHAPSLRTLAQLRTREASRGREEGRGEPAVTVIGCRNEHCPDGPVRVHPFAATPIPELTFADQEARRVAAFYPRARILVGPEADEAFLRTVGLSDADILHFAAHGYADAHHPERSFIVLNRSCTDQPAAPEDGLLLWPEIASLDLGASLVVLAACHSAGGPLAVGEGVTGLTQAFLDAGSTCVLAALDDVPDRYALRFMTDFHRRLARGESPATALRSTQAAARARDGRWWASFVLVGDGIASMWDAPPTRRRGGLYLAVASVAAILAVMLAVMLAVRRKARSRSIDR